jgi:ribosomal-protein-serine acetyltransferase
LTDVPRLITTGRLTLEATSLGHGDPLWQAVSASLTELRKWMPWAIEPSLQDTLAYVAAVDKQWDNGTGWNFTIALNQEAIGCIGLGSYDVAVKSCSLGYWLRSDCAGNGYITEAGSHVTAVAFQDVGLHRLCLQAAVDNRASARVAEKLGFRREGRLRHGSRGAEGWHDTYLYGLISDDDRLAPH